MTVDRLFNGVQRGDHRFFTPLADEGQGGLNFGLHRTGRELTVAQVRAYLVRADLFQKLLPGGVEVNGGTGDIGGNDESIGPNFLGQGGTDQVLVDDGIHPVE